MTVQTEAEARGARVVFIPPPLYYALGLVAGALLSRAVPLTIGGRPATTFAGVVLCVLGGALTAAGVVSVIRHRTTIVPHHAVATLVTTGAYRLSRNPMYTGLATAYLGAALLLGTWWAVLFWPLILLVVYRLVIRPEEAYLGVRFPTAYATYRARVRRWL